MNNDKPLQHCSSLPYLEWGDLRKENIRQMLIMYEMWLLESIFNLVK